MNCEGWLAGIDMVMGLSDVVGIVLVWHFEFTHLS